MKTLAKISIIMMVILTTVIIHGCNQSQKYSQRNGQDQPVMYDTDDMAEEADEGMVYDHEKVKKEDKRAVSDNDGGIVHNTEEYDRVYENEFKDVKQNPLSF